MDLHDDRQARPSRMHVGGKLSSRRRVGQRDPEMPESLPLRIGGEDPPPLHELVPPGYSEVEIEVGPGKGAFLVAATKARPDTFLLGIEAATPYAEFAAEKLSKAGLKNGLLLVDNARLYLADRVEAGALARVHVYYPDPWPKRRHRSRRFFTPEILPVLHRALAKDGWLLVATDNAAYAGQIWMLLGASPLFTRDLEQEHLLLTGDPGHGFTPTSFERKYLEQGRVLRRSAWRRNEVPEEVMRSIEAEAQAQLAELHAQASREEDPDAGDLEAGDHEIGDR